MTGGVGQITMTASEIAALTHTSITVTGRGQPTRYDGVPLIELVKRAGAPSGDALRYQVVAPADKRPTRWVRQVVSIEVARAPAVAAIQGRVTCCRTQSPAAVRRSRG